MRPTNDDASGPLWVFGYGSLIWNPGFEFVDSALAHAVGWRRRFWQGSHDHRGMPHAPGRVVTLIAEPGARCHGRMFRIDAARRVAILAALDHREKNGYERVWLDVMPAGGTTPRRALTYVAPPGNHAYLGPAPLDEMAAQIAVSAGPSGSNRDYLLELAQSLRAHGIEDPHVDDLAQRVRARGRP